MARSLVRRALDGLHKRVHPEPLDGVPRRFKSSCYPYVYRITRALGRHTFHVEDVADPKRRMGFPILSLLIAWSSWISPSWTSTLISPALSSCIRMIMMSGFAPPLKSFLWMVVVLFAGTMIPQFCGGVTLHGCATAGFQTTLLPYHHPDVFSALGAW